MKMFRTPRFLRLVYYRRTWGFSWDNPAVYLTFDDGPHPDITPWVLDELRNRKIKATFFCVGDNVRKYPEIYRRILEEGHAVGNHTMRHEHALKVNERHYLDSVSEASSYIDSSLFRPPYGRLKPSLARKLAHRYRIVMWSWLSYDFDLDVETEDILRRAEKQVTPGDILVLHDNPKIAVRQKELLPRLLEILQQKKFRFEKLT